ncbi:competence protein [Tenuibacillus multivorans]|nr:competence protein [Tenuibacillus multivorans]
MVAYNKSPVQLEIIRQQPLYCPECQCEVILKAGAVTIPHFAHVTHSNCSSQKGEGEAHLKGKLDLYHWLRKQGIQAKLEHSLPSIQQRIDILIKLNRKYAAIEYQCSPISHEELMKRTLGIASKNIFPIWIFGDRYYPSKHAMIKWNTTLRTSVMYLPKIKQTKLFFYDSMKARFSIASDIYTHKSKAIAQLHHDALNRLKWKDLFQHRPLPQSILFKKWYIEKKYFRSSSRRFVSKYDEAYLKELYYLHLHPQSLPSCVHLPVKNAHRYLTPHYIWQTQVMLYIHQTPIYSKITWHEIRRISQKYFYHHIDSIYPGEFLHPAYDYLKLLVKIGYLEQLGYSTFKKVKEVYFPNTLDEALKEDQLLLEKLLKF